MFAVITRKWQSLKFRLSRWFAIRKTRTAAGARRRAMQRWRRRLERRHPDVIVGLNEAEGGVGVHIRAIARHSALTVQPVPDDSQIGAFDEELQKTFAENDRRLSPVVHSHVAPWFIRWCRRQKAQGVHWIHTYHNNYSPEFTETGQLFPWQEAINEALLNEAPHADVRISVSKWQQALLRDRYGIETIYIPNGVDVALCDEGCAERFRDRVGREDFILYVGKNAPVKNPRAFLRLVAQCPDRRFMMLGKGLDPETIERQLGFNVPGNLLALGPATHNEVQDALAACSALVVTSRSEGLPTLVLEGMAHVKPVVVPDEPGCLEAVDHGNCGHVYRQDDLQSLADALLAALDDSRTPVQARARVLAEYDWRVVAGKLDAVYTR